MPAADLARLLVEPLRAEAERPSWAGARVAVLLDGLGRTKYEELFVLYADVARLLGAAGVEIVEPEVGELVTSLDMAGCSLTLFWLDEELEELWSAPADSPGYRKPGLALPRKAAPAQPGTITVSPDGGGLRADQDFPATTRGPEGPAEVALVKSALIAMLEAVEAAEDELGRMDAVAGDGDHGQGMVRGLQAAVAAASAAGESPGEVLITAGAAWREAAGGASGALWGAMLEAFGRTVLQHGTTADAVSRGLTGSVDALVSLGGARRGDKTMLDALSPFVETYVDRVKRGDGAISAWLAAVPACEEGARRTAELVSRRGRSAVLGDRSLGTPDPGALSLAYCVDAVGRALTAYAESEGA